MPTADMFDAPTSFRDPTATCGSSTSALERDRPRRRATAADRHDRSGEERDRVVGPARGHRERAAARRHGHRPVRHHAGARLDRGGRLRAGRGHVGSGRRDRDRAPAGTVIYYRLVATNAYGTVVREHAQLHDRWPPPPVASRRRERCTRRSATSGSRHGPGGDAVPRPPGLGAAEARPARSPARRRRSSRSNAPRCSSTAASGGRESSRDGPPPQAAQAGDRVRPERHRQPPAGDAVAVAARSAPRAPHAPVDADVHAHAPRQTPDRAHACDEDDHDDVHRLRTDGRQLARYVGVRRGRGQTQRCCDRLFSAAGGSNLLRLWLRDGCKADCAR